MIGMRTPIVVAFASGCATAAMAGWLTAALRAQAPADSSVNVIHACAAADGVLRVAPPSGSCPAGQTSLFFRKDTTPQSGPLSPPPKDTTDSRIRALETRIAALERDASLTGVGRRVTAPFEVLDRSGKRVFAVLEDHTARLYNVAGQDLVRLETTDTSGFVVAANGAGMVATIGASGTEASFKLLEGQAVRTELGRNVKTGNYRALFNAPGGSVRVAAIGETDIGSGQAFVADKGGNIRATMAAAESSGMFSAYNAAGVPVATLTEGKTAGGLLEITSSSGERMVVAGVQPGGFGVVQAGPASFMQAAGLGLPGSYIAGKAK
jgi:hypothetical protein